jgi:hypothetical protein
MRRWSDVSIRAVFFKSSKKAANEFVRPSFVAVEPPKNVVLSVEAICLQTETFVQELPQSEFLVSYTGAKLSQLIVSGLTTAE